MLAERWGRLEKNERLVPVVASLRADLNHLTDLYTRMVYRDQVIARSEGRRAIATWSRLSRRLRWINFRMRG